MDLMMKEQPTHVVMNGSAAALAGDQMKAKVGDNIRIFFGVGGPNLTSSFHAIGAVFDKVWTEGYSTKLPAKTDVQTIAVPPGGSAMVEFKARVPAMYILVDQAYTRLMKGNVGIISVEGPDQPDLFRAGKLKK